MIKSKTFSEVNAMEAIDEALSNLDDPSRARVLNWASAKFGSQPAHQQPPAPNLGGRPQSGSAPNADMTIKAFIAQKRPSNFYERVACLAYYLERFGATTEVKTRDIRKANIDARLSRLSNPALFVKHAADTYGYLSRVGHGTFAVSSRGEAVVDALPDRGQVEQALEQHPFKTKAKKSSKKS